MPVLGDVCDPPRPPGLCNFSACLLLWPHLHQAPPKVPRVPPPPFRWPRPPPPLHEPASSESPSAFSSPAPLRPGPAFLAPFSGPASSGNLSTGPPWPHPPQRPCPYLAHRYLVSLLVLHRLSRHASLSLVLFSRNPHLSPYLHVSLSKPCLLCTFSALLRSLIPVRSKLCP